MNTMTRKKKESTPGENLAKQIIEQYNPKSVEDMQNAMSDLEKFINENVDYDPLIRVALIHYQFETIHPFLDGNGRIGRLLILLYLMEQGLLAKPVIYISYFLKKNQIEYYDRISEVRRSGNFEQWIRFFWSSSCQSCPYTPIFT